VLDLTSFANPLTDKLAYFELTLKKWRFDRQYAKAFWQFIQQAPLLRSSCRGATVALIALSAAASPTFSVNSRHIRTLGVDVGRQGTTPLCLLLPALSTRNGCQLSLPMVGTFIALQSPTSRLCNVGDRINVS